QPSRRGHAFPTGDRPPARAGTGGGGPAHKRLGGAKGRRLRVRWRAPGRGWLSSGCGSRIDDGCWRPRIQQRRGEHIAAPASSSWRGLLRCQADLLVADGTMLASCRKLGEGVCEHGRGHAEFTCEPSDEVSGSAHYNLENRLHAVVMQAECPAGCRGKKAVGVALEGAGRPTALGEHLLRREGPVVTLIGVEMAVPLEGVDDGGVPHALRDNLYFSACTEGQRSVSGSKPLRRRHFVSLGEEGANPLGNVLVDDFGGQHAARFVAEHQVRIDIGPPQDLEGLLLSPPVLLEQLDDAQGNWQSTMAVFGLRVGGVA